MKKILHKKRHEEREKHEGHEGHEGHEERAGRCYELACKYMLIYQRGILVHAEVYSYKLERTIDHALVETDTGLIYEPVSDRYFRKGWLYDTFKVKEHKRYTVEEAMIMTIKTGTYGPWSTRNE